jgi:glycine oxidase
MKIVIVGAGVAGLSIGWLLLQKGASVTVLDRAQPAHGATWAAAGMLALLAELEDAAAAEVALAREGAALWPAFAAELEAASGRSVGLSRSGTLILAADGSELEAMRPRGQVLDRDQVVALAPMLAPVAGALWASDEAHVDNRALGEALTIAFLKAGGTLLPNEAVVAIDRKGGKATAVLTPYGRYDADVFLIAAGAWSGLLDDIPMIPVKGEMIALMPPPGAALPGPMIWGNDVYLVPRGGRLLVGATMSETGFDTALTVEARDRLRNRAEALIPSLTSWALDEHWAGLRPKSPDGLPLLGPTATPNLFVAGGQFRNGILFAPAIAQHMAAMLLGEETPVPDFDPRRFP